MKLSSVKTLQYSKSSVICSQSELRHGKARSDLATSGSTDLDADGIGQFGQRSGERTHLLDGTVCTESDTGKGGHCIGLPEKPD